MKSVEDLEKELKQFIVETLALEDVNSEDIQGNTPLFGDGLGLDSVDALELGVALQKRYQVKIAAGAPETRNHFANVKNLASFIAMAKQDAA